MKMHDIVWFKTELSYFGHRGDYLYNNDAGRIGLIIALVHSHPTRIDPVSTKPDKEFQFRRLYPIGAELKVFVVRAFSGNDVKTASVLKADRLMTLNLSPTEQSVGVAAMIIQNEEADVQMENGKTLFFERYRFSAADREIFQGCNPMPFRHFNSFLLKREMFFSH